MSRCRVYWNHLAFWRGICHWKIRDSRWGSFFGTCPTLLVRSKVGCGWLWAQCSIQWRSQKWARYLVFWRRLWTFLSVRTRHALYLFWALHLLLLLRTFCSSKVETTLCKRSFSLYYSLKWKKIDNLTSESSTLQRFPRPSLTVEKIAEGKVLETTLLSSRREIFLCFSSIFRSLIDH